MNLISELSKCVKRTDLQRKKGKHWCNIEQYWRLSNGVVRWKIDDLDIKQDSRRILWPMKNMSRLVLARLSEAWFVGDEFAANGSHDKRFLSNIGGLLRDISGGIASAYRCHRRRRRYAIWSRSYVVRLDSDVRAELDYAAGLLDGVIEEVGVGCDHRAAPRRSGSIERKGKKSFRQTRIPEASRHYKDQGSMISVR